MPATHNEATEKLQAETKQDIEAHLTKFKEESEKQLEEMVKKYEDRLKQREKQPEDLKSEPEEENVPPAATVAQ